jgi:uncharacterized delta-60 repeat protein
MRRTGGSLWGDPMSRLARRITIAVAVLGVLLCAPHVRATPDGYFDTTWRGTGHFNIDPGNYLTRVGKIIVEPNGNLTIAGAAYDGTNSYWWIGQLLANGQPVPPFGIANGIGYITSCQLGLVCHYDMPDTYYDALAQPDGKYLVLSQQELARTTTLAHALDTAGVVGGNGYVNFSPSQINDAQGKVYPFHLALQPDGKVLAAGYGQYEGISPSTHAMGVLRLNSNLSPDLGFSAYTDTNQVTFAGGNVIVFDATDDHESADKILLQPDGHIVLVGAAGTSAGGWQLAITRLTSDGLLDPTFATSGGTNGHKKFTLDDKNPIDVDTVAATFDGTGRIIAAVNVTVAPGFIMARVSGDGNTIESLTQALDGCTNSKIETVTLDSAGRILAAGYCLGDKYYFLTLRFRNDAALALDTSFGLNGVTRGWFDSAADNASAKQTYGETMAIDASGRPVIGGYSNGTPDEAGMARLTYDLIFTGGLESPAGCLSPNCN